MARKCDNHLEMCINTYVSSVTKRASDSFSSNICILSVTTKMNMHILKYSEGKIQPRFSSFSYNHADWDLSTFVWGGDLNWWWRLRSSWGWFCFLVTFVFSPLWWETSGPFNMSEQHLNKLTSICNSHVYLKHKLCSCSSFCQQIQRSEL